MDRRFENEEFEAGAQGGRSPSGVPDSNSSGMDRGSVEGAARVGGGCGHDPGEGPRRGPVPPQVDGEAPAHAGGSPGLVEGRTVFREGSGGLPGFLRPRPPGRTYQKPGWERDRLTPQERLLLLDTWGRSGLSAGDFSALVGISKHTLYAWKQRFQTRGPEGLLDRPKGGPRGSKLPDLTRRTILMLKESHPEWGVQRISDMLLRGPALPASPGAVTRVLREAGYVLEEEPTRPHEEAPRSFERAAPNDLWQTDLFTFVLKRQNRRVYLVVFMDDHSRFIVGYGLGASATGAWVMGIFRAALSSYQAPREVLTDNGPQYVTWRGRSLFSRELEKHGVKHIVSSPRHPQTLGKVERFWGTLWRECVSSAVFLDLLDAERRVGLFIDHYNLQRPNQGIGGLVPADRFFRAAPEVLRTLKDRAAANALDLARHGLPRAPFYLTGQVGGKSFSVHAEGERVILHRGEGGREEIDLTAGTEEGAAAGERKEAEAAAELPLPLCPSAAVPEGVAEEEPPEPGTSPLDELVQPGGEAFPPGRGEGGVAPDPLPPEREAGEEPGAEDGDARRGGLSHGAP